MRKAFTLAEVLITLIVIGVIAALTVPALLQNIQDAQYKTAWRKTYSDINQATQRILIDNAGSFNGFFNSSYKIATEYSLHLNYLKKCPEGSALGNCWHDNTGNSRYLNNNIVNTWPDTAGLILGNGVILSFVANSLSCTFDHGIPICGRMFVDINGFKSPNIVGKDIFGFWIVTNGIKPFGTPGDWYYNATGYECDTAGNGITCAAEYLKQ